jgi:ribosome-associated protein
MTAQLPDSSLQLAEKIQAVLEDMKGKDILSINMENISDFTDVMIIASGTSGRHLKAMADSLIETLKKSNINPIGTEGQDTNDWVLVDYGDAIVHLMLPEVREYYDLERLWKARPAGTSQSTDQ